MHCKGLLLLVCVSCLFTSCTGTISAFFPLMTGTYALQAVFRLGIIYIGACVYILAGVHSGYRRQTIHTKPEFEQIIEVLDVPEDVYLTKKIHQDLNETDASKRTLIKPLLNVDNKGRVVTGKSKRKYNLRNGKKHTFTKKHGVVREITEKEDPGIKEEKGFLRKFFEARLKRRVPCHHLLPGSPTYKRHCQQKTKVPHVDAISFLYPDYLPWKAAPSTLKKLKGQSYLRNARFFIPKLLKKLSDDKEAEDPVKVVV